MVVGAKTCLDVARAVGWSTGQDTFNITIGGETRAFYRLTGVWHAPASDLHLRRKCQLSASDSDPFPIWIILCLRILLCTGATLVTILLTPLGSRCREAAKDRSLKVTVMTFTRRSLPKNSKYPKLKMYLLTFPYVIICIVNWNHIVTFLSYLWTFSNTSESINSFNYI